MKVIWSPIIDEGKDFIIGYVDSDWDINLCYFWIHDKKYPIVVEIEILFHEIVHWLIRSYTFAELWDRLWKPIFSSI